MCIGYWVYISLSDYEIELDQIVQRAVVNEAVLIALLYKLPDQLQELFSIARPPTDKRLAP